MKIPKSTRTVRYVVVRHGSNAANQHKQPRRVLGTVEATNRQAAAKKAAERWTCYNNQFLSLWAYSTASQKDRTAADREDALARNPSEPIYPTDPNG